MSIIGTIYYPFYYYGGNNRLKGFRYLVGVDGDLIGVDIKELDDNGDDII